MGFEKGESLVEAGTLEEVGEPGVDGCGELVLQRRDLLRNGAEPVEVAGGIASKEFAVRDDRETFAERGGEGLLDGGLGRHGGNNRAGRGGVHYEERGRGARRLVLKHAANSVTPRGKEEEWESGKEESRKKREAANAA